VHESSPDKLAPQLFACDPLIMAYKHDYFFWVSRPQRAGMTLLALLAMTVALQAQTGTELRTGIEEPGVNLNVGSDSIPAISAPPLRLETPAAETAEVLDSTRPATETQCNLHPLPLIVNACAQISGSDGLSQPKFVAQFEFSGSQPHIVPGSNSDQPTVEISHNSNSTDFNRDIYYKNKLEFSLEGGWLPINIPWPFDVFMGDGYTTSGVNYTLVPIMASLRWHMDDVGGPWIFRGNWDCTFSASVTAIPRGPETRYFSYIMGFRRNFVRPRWRAVPYFNAMGGLGQIDAKGPLGVYGAQGQNFTFTLNMGSGVRYNFNPRYAVSAGINYMHISNFYLSEPKFLNYGINVYGPMVGIDVQLNSKGHHSE